MRKNRAPVFRGRHFQDEVIVTCVRWYLRYSLSYRDLEEMMAERGLSVDHSTIARWVLRYCRSQKLGLRLKQERGARLRLDVLTVVTLMRTGEVSGLSRACILKST